MCAHHLSLSLPRSFLPRTVTCVAPPSTPGKKRLTITVNEVTSSVDRLDYEYKRPEIFTLSPTTGPTYGAITVDIRGIGLGLATSPPLVRFGKGPAVCEHPTVIVPHLHLQCSLPSTLAPGSTSVVVSVSGVTSISDKRSTFRYQPPIITSVTPEEGATYGDWQMELVGDNFGRTSSHIRILVGNLPCRDVTRIDSKTLQCLSPPSVPGKTSVVVEVDGVGSDQKSTSGA